VFHHILVPLDGSIRAERALPVAAQIARGTAGSLHLVYVVNPPIDYSGGLSPMPIMSAETIEIETKNATSYLNAMAMSPLLAGIPTTTEVQFGVPAAGILATASKRAADLIVLCSHGRTGYTRWILGSVAHTLVHESPVPLFVLREGASDSLLAPDGSARPLRVLVPLDGSELAEAALDPAASLTAALAAPGQGTLYLAQVVKEVNLPPSSAGAAAASRLNEEVKEHANAYLAQVREQLQARTKELRLSITSSVLCASDVASALVELAEHGDEGEKSGSAAGCDLIAISTHGRHGLQRWVMGSVTERVLNTSKLPILIVRPQQQG
jgi:nucleotide-binding universal stress UspA family protein